ncbi:hypothetical protein CRG98_030733 [Punica granatum]|uniref:Uncharacterized protein n=1 Tax=Punica granatum TaxID=22663 RepID=A0A2I0IY71_PUNGR|nr:hypothetical protein CRG98_030733 [Punica granatum]
MPTLHSASLLKAQCGIVGMNHTTHLDPSSSALRVSDALFIFLEAPSWQTEIVVIFGSPKKLRKQYEKSSFSLLGHLRLHICSYRLKSQVSTLISSFRVKIVLSGEQCTRSSPLPRARVRPQVPARTLDVRAHPNVHPLHPSILPSVLPSHPALEHFPDSFLVSQD